MNLETQKKIEDLEIKKLVCWQNYQQAKEDIFRETALLQMLTTCQEIIKTYKEYVQHTTN